MTVNSDHIKEEELCFLFQKKNKSQIMLTRIFISWLNKQLESASKQHRVVRTECIRH